MSLKVEEVMTKMPHTIGKEIPVSQAQKMMRDNGFRHLPVREAGKLVGMISDRDIQLATTFGSVEEIVVEDVMSQEPFTVHPEDSVIQAIERMTEKKYGAAIVADSQERVVGIFTEIDALRLLAERLKDE